LRRCAADGLRRLSGAASPPRLASAHVSLPGGPLRYSQAPSGFGSPAFKRYYETSKTAPPFNPPASVSLATGLHRCFPVFARHDPGKPGRGAWTFCNRCRPCPVVRWRGAALPAFQETPVYLCTALRSRSGRRARGPRHSRMTTYCEHGDTVPPGKNRKTRAVYVFRDSITRLQHSLHTLRAPLAGTLRNVRCRVAANLSRAGLATRWVSATGLFILSFVSSCSVCWRDSLNVSSQPRAKRVAL
jgi:hypothetical protein